MKRVFNNVVEAIGDTPVVRLNSLTKGLECEVYVKLEYCNPGGSVKDRIALEMVVDAEKSGRLKPGGTIVEATSGNTGQGLAMVAAIRGYKCIFVMPDKMSDEKVRNLRAYGARVVITPTAVAPEDPRSYYSVSKRLAQETPNAILANQYHNPANPAAHYKNTGPEIWDQMGAELDYFCLGLGTGGTVTGTGKYLQEKKPAIQIVGVDPEGSVYYEFFNKGTVPSLFKTYKIEGVGEDFMPSTIDFKYVNHVVQVGDKEAFTITRRMAQEEGILCGGSAGMAVAGALKFAREKNLPKGKRMLVILPDSGAKYLSKIFNDDWMREYGFLEAPVLGNVQEIISGKTPGMLITAQSSDPVRKLIQVMKEKGISQVPVMDGEKLAGLITEVALLNFMLEAEHNIDKPIGPIVERDVPTVPSDAPIGKLKEIFQKGKVAVVVDNGKVTGIVTKIDMIDFLATKVA